MLLLEIDWNNFYVFYGRITIAAMILPVLAALLFRRYWNRALYAAFWYFLMTFLLNVSEQIFIWSTGAYYESFKPFLDYFQITNTNFIKIFYYLKDFFFLGWFFSLIFSSSRLRSSVKWVSLLLILATSINYLFIEGYQGHGFFNPVINALYVILLPILYLWISQKSSLRIPLRKNPYFWISIGLFLPNLLALFLYFTGDYIYTTNYPLFVILSSIKNTFEMIGLVMVSFGFVNARFARFVTDG
ncbi:MAG: hypothetical protein AAF990_04455 [Bacteroidota bacterium]